MAETLSEQDIAVLKTLVPLHTLTDEGMKELLKDGAHAFVVVGNNRTLAGGEAIWAD